jgi:hypothetical protein
MNIQVDDENSAELTDTGIFNARHPDHDNEFD